MFISRVSNGVQKEKGDKSTNLALNYDSSSNHPVQYIYEKNESHLPSSL
jgi:hypothetical protein